MREAVWHHAEGISGQEHRKGPPLSQSQRVVMASSSLLYCVPAATFWALSFHNLGRLFCLVSGFSVAADALSGLLPGRAMRVVRLCDRSVGTLELMLAVYVNSTTRINFVLSMAAVLTSLAWLAKGRMVGASQPDRRWKYLFYHAGWHAWGAAALNLVTTRAQGGVAT